MPFAEKMDLEIIILSQVNQRKKSYDITCLWTLKKETNTFIYKMETHRHRKQI